MVCFETIINNKCDLKIYFTTFNALIEISGKKDKREVVEIDKETVLEGKSAVENFVFSNLNTK